MNQLRPIFCLFICVTLPLAWPAGRWANAEPAHFWISTSKVATSGPDAPVIKRANGTGAFLHIWAQPMTDKELQNISLNLVADQPVIDFLDDEIVIYNPDVFDPDPMRNDTLPRFEFVFDSNSDPALESDVNGGGAPDRIEGLQAFTIHSEDFAGIGPECGGGEPLCVSTGGGPAWLIASIGYETVQDSGTVNIDLQIGSNGMNHTGESSMMTTVVFGTGSAEYNAANHREESDMFGDTAEMVITACAAIAGDYNGNCVVDAADYTIWRDTLGSTTDLRADGNDNDEIDAGDYTEWKLNFGTVSGSGAGSGSLFGLAVPEPSTLALLLALGGCWMLTSRGAGGGQVPFCCRLLCCLANRARQKGT